MRVICDFYHLYKGVRDTNYPLAVHDIKLLLLRFAYEKSFSDDTGGGGPESNLHLIPYLFQMVLYVLNTTRFYQREEKNIAQVGCVSASDMAFFSGSRHGFHSIIALVRCDDLS